MPGVLIFGGTTEGRELLAQYPGATVCVTSRYARSLLPEGTDCRVGALEPDDMDRMMGQMCPDLVIDATHPYAVRVTEAVSACCRERGIPYRRVTRPVTSAGWRQYVRTVPDAEAAAEALKDTEGNILLTTGSHTLAVYGSALDTGRVWARVLPTTEALELCRRAGILPSHIIAMQGPFTPQLNGALYDQLRIRVMVTRDSGEPGGVDEKVIPALERDMQVILIARPEEH